MNLPSPISGIFDSTRSSKARSPSKIEVFVQLDVFGGSQEQTPLVEMIVESSILILSEENFTSRPTLKLFIQPLPYILFTLTTNGPNPRLASARQIQLQLTSRYILRSKTATTRPKDALSISRFAIVPITIACAVGDTKGGV